MSMDIESLWDDSERVVRYTQSGIRTVRPYTPEENAAADARAAQAAALAQREATRTAVRAIVDDLKAIRSNEEERSRRELVEREARALHERWKREGGQA